MAFPLVLGLSERTGPDERGIENRGAPGTVRGRNSGGRGWGDERGKGRLGACQWKVRYMFEVHDGEGSTSANGGTVHSESTCPRTNLHCSFQWQVQKAAQHSLFASTLPSASEALFRAHCEAVGGDWRLPLAGTGQRKETARLQGSFRGSRTRQSNKKKNPGQRPPSG